MPRPRTFERQVKLLLPLQEVLADADSVSCLTHFPRALGIT